MEDGREGVWKSGEAPKGAAFVVQLEMIVKSRNSPEWLVEGACPGLQSALLTFSCP